MYQPTYGLIYKHIYTMPFPEEEDEVLEIEDPQDIDEELEDEESEEF